MENKRHHLEMIQGVINRMARCSFLLKGWSVVIISALFALSVKECDSRLIVVAYFPALVFLGIRCILFMARKIIQELI